jgi:putative membrane protein
VPFIVRTERKTLRNGVKSCWCFPLGLIAVVALAALRRSPLMSTAVHFSALSAADCLYVLATGALAVGATVLPGISGSSVLMIFGVYVPALRAVRELLALDLAVLPGLALLALGFVIGAAVFARVIRRAMAQHRAQMLWAILGLMCGSLYAICLGPATMELPPLTLSTFRPLAFALGVAVLLSLEAVSRALERRSKPNT